MMRKVFTGFLFFVSSYTLLIESVYDFSSAKTYYSLWNPEKYFVSDTLIYDRTEDSDSEMSSPATYYYGQLQKYKTKGRVLSRNGGFVDSKVSVKYCVLSSEIFYDSDNKVGGPFSFQFIDTIFNAYMVFIWLPNLIYFTYLQTMREKLKVILLLLIGLYFTFLFYEIITDFTVIKSIHSYF